MESRLVSVNKGVCGQSSGSKQTGGALGPLIRDLVSPFNYSSPVPGGAAPYRALPSHFLTMASFTSQHQAKAKGGRASKGRTFNPPTHVLDVRNFHLKKNIYIQWGTV